MLGTGHAAGLSRVCSHVDLDGITDTRPGEMVSTTSSCCDGQTAGVVIWNLIECIYVGIDFRQEDLVPQSAVLDIIMQMPWLIVRAVFQQFAHNVILIPRSNSNRTKSSQQDRSSRSSRDLCVPDHVREGDGVIRLERQGGPGLTKSKRTHSAFHFFI